MNSLNIYSTNPYTKNLQLEGAPETKVHQFKTIESKTEFQQVLSNFDFPIGVCRYAKFFVWSWIWILLCPNNIHRETMDQNECQRFGSQSSKI